MARFLGSKAESFTDDLTKVINEEMKDFWTIEKIADKDVEDFLKYKESVKTYQEFTELTIGVCSELESQSRILEDLQQDMRKVLAKL